MIYLVIGLFLFCMWACTVGLQAKKDLREDIAQIKRQRDTY
jgi:hypothetical protein